MWDTGFATCISHGSPAPTRWYHDRSYISCPFTIEPRLQIPRLHSFSYLERLIQEPLCDPAHRTDLPELDCDVCEPGGLEGGGEGQQAHRVMGPARAQVCGMWGQASPRPSSLEAPRLGCLGSRIPEEQRGIHPHAARRAGPSARGSELPLPAVLGRTRASPAGPGRWPTGNCTYSLHLLAPSGETIPYLVKLQRNGRPIFLDPRCNPL